MKSKKLMIVSLAVLLAVGSAFAPKSKSSNLLTNLWAKDANGNCVQYDCETNFTISCNGYFNTSQDCVNQLRPVTTTLKHQ